MNSNIRPAIITFPGSNCEQDIAGVLRDHYQLDPHFIWHGEEALPKGITHVVLPGGFSFGDYLRAGALAAVAPILKSVANFASAGGPVLGICNGFQILCEAKLLPGMLMRNHHDRFVCQTISMTWRGRTGEGAEALSLPIAHRDGRFFADEETLRHLREHKKIMLTYNDCDDDGHAMVNGSQLSIAGIVGGPCRNIMGLMPHPERAIFAPRGSVGTIILNEFLYGEGL